MPSHRIITDVGKCYGINLEIICIAEGWAVQGVGNRNGHRRDDSYFGPPAVRERMQRRVSPFGWGGKRTKRKAAQQPDWIHPDAAAARKEWIWASRRKYHGAAANADAMGMVVPSWMWCV